MLSTVFDPLRVTQTNKTILKIGSINDRHSNITFFELRARIIFQGTSLACITKILIVCYKCFKITSIIQAVFYICSHPFHSIAQKNIDNTLTILET